MAVSLAQSVARWSHNALGDILRPPVQAVQGTLTGVVLATNDLVVFWASRLLIRTCCFHVLAIGLRDPELLDRRDGWALIGLGRTALLFC